MRALSLVPLLALLLGPRPAAAEGPAPAAAAPEPASFEWIGADTLAPGLRFEGEPVGGLSALAWDAGSGEFLALSDDRSELAPARIYRLRIDLSDGRLDRGGVEVVGRIHLETPDGSLFAKRSLDPEGLALVGGHMYVSSEGEANVGLAPFVAEFESSGREIAPLPLPARYLPDGRGTWGVRDNLAFESLAATPDGAWLFSGTENALVQDGPAADAGVASPSRLLRWRLPAGGGRPTGLPTEYLYRVEGVSVTPPNPSAFRVNGLVELIALSPTSLLALERQFISGVGVDIRLYRVELDGATDISRIDGPFGDDVVPARKVLLFDFADLGIPLDNLEGMTFGPVLPDGRRSFVVVADDNFDAAAQRTLVVAFAVDDTPVTIAAIQGAAHRSPLEGRWISGVEGVVTAVVDRPRDHGFWIQSEHPDDDPATSEGLFVAWDGASTLAVGDRVRVGGRVVEAARGADQLPVTTLTVASLEKLGSGASLPPPVRLGIDRQVPAVLGGGGLTTFDPAARAIDFWESLEGMRVELPAGVVSGPTLRYGELAWMPPDLAGAPRSVAGGAMLTESGPSTRRVLLSQRLLGELPRLAVGTRLAGPVTGIVDYSFSNYQLALTAPLQVSGGGFGCDERTALTGDRNHLTVATLNVENLSAAGPPERFAALGRVIASNLSAPALVALEEIQDDSGPTRGDGVVTSRATLDALVEAVASAGGPRYRAIWIDPEPDREGGQPGGNIRVALLLDPARVRFTPRGSAAALDETTILGRGDAARLSLNPGRVAPRSDAFTPVSGEGVRRSLAVEVEVSGRPVFVIVNHWSSKYEDDRDYGAVQPPRRPTAARRQAQAREIRAFVDRLLELDAGARIVVLGDFNAVPWSEAVQILARPPLEDLIGRVAPNRRYTFNFEGEAEAIDHVVVSPRLAEGAQADVVHVDADCPVGIRASDHDPVVARVPIH
jgi:predicted extracellular nuclease